MMDNLGPSQDYPDYEIPKELAPDGVEVVGDYVPISPMDKIILIRLHNPKRI
uniref:Uncharacterized protein n=1 Tax=Brassica oleracea TaxID=3712 RepID=A0A3P6DNC2_BRAOL|nr:unnamed protein product [Brassica oleracea]